VGPEQFGQRIDGAAHGAARIGLRVPISTRTWLVIGIGRNYFVYDLLLAALATALSPGD
jgi:hypothetical protein